MAIRSTHGLEVPLSHKGKLMVTEEYIEFLLKIANQKMEENKKRIERYVNWIFLCYSYISRSYLKILIHTIFSLYSQLLFYL